MGFMGIKYTFQEKIWAHNGKGSWYFVSLPFDFSKEIRENLQSEEEGWGRLKATAKIGITEWKTAIWYDTKLKTYLLPIKKDIRKIEQLNIGLILTINIWI
jgi:hypothetical protein